MAIEVNAKGINYAEGLIRDGKINLESDWEFTAEDGNKILGDNDWERYAKWFLAIDTDANEETKEHYKYPYGKNNKVYRSGIIAAKQRASQQGQNNVRDAADELLQMIEEKGEKSIEIPVQELKIEKLTRELEIEKRDVSKENRTIKLAFSSEAPIKRFFGTEILDHNYGSIMLDRFKNGGIPLLINHNPDDVVGITEDVSIGNDRRGRAIVRFGKSARAEEIFQDVLDGIRRSISVGYQIHKVVLEKKEEGEEVYRVTKWEPLEISLASIPADISVGINRNKEIIKKEVKMEDTTILEKERKRVEDIIKLGEIYNQNKLVNQAIGEGRSVDEFKGMLLEKLHNAKPVDLDPNIGLSEKEKKDYRIIRGIQALASGSWKGAEFEREVSDVVAKRLHKTSQGFFVPHDVMDISKRDLLKGTPSAGGYTVATELLTPIIELLRNKMMVQVLGAKIMGGLVGDVAIPRQSGGGTAYWVAENAAPTEADQTFAQLALSPKTVGAITDISRKLLLQTSIDVEAFVREDLATILALAIDLAAINGSGAGNQPTGILNATGVSLVEIGANGGAPAWSHIVSLESKVSAANADVGSLAYLTNVKVRGTLKQTQRFSSTDTPVWENSPEIGFGMVNGYRAGASNQVPSNLTKGTGVNLSAIIFGNFADLIIAQWGTLDITVDPYAGATTGAVRVIVLQDVDIAIRHPESFSKIVDADTV